MLQFIASDALLPGVVSATGAPHERPYGARRARELTQSIVAAAAASTSHAESISVACRLVPCLCNSPTFVFQDDGWPEIASLFALVGTASRLTIRSIHPSAKRPSSFRGLALVHGAASHVLRWLICVSRSFTVACCGRARVLKVVKRISPAARCVSSHVDAGFECQCIVGKQLRI